VEPNAAGTKAAGSKYWCFGRPCHAFAQRNRFGLFSTFKSTPVIQITASIITSELKKTMSNDGHRDRDFQGYSVARRSTEIPKGNFKSKKPGGRHRFST
jgi:hypothetical protein